MSQPQQREAEPLLSAGKRQPLRLNAADRRRVVVKFLGGLKPRERQLLSLHFFEQLGEEEIGGLTAMGAEEVRVRLRRLLCGVEAALLVEDEAAWRGMGGAGGRAR